MSPVLKVILIVLVVLVAVIAILYFLGRKAQKKQAEQQAQIEAAKQTVTMLIIDKKKAAVKRFRSSSNGHGTDAQIFKESEIPHCKS